VPSYPNLVHEIDTLSYEGFAVLPEYLDRNGHMNIGYYSVVFDQALDRPWALLGLGYDNIAPNGRGGHSSFALESHVTYQRELRLGDPLDFTFQIIDIDAKRIHYFMTMLHRHERWRAATLESISMCINMSTRRSAAWPDDPLARMQTVYEAHRLRPRPAEVGRTLGIRRK
jgi:acyl-CoA thioester hydrolase